MLIYTKVTTLYSKYFILFSTVHNINYNLFGLFRYSNHRFQMFETFSTSSAQNFGSIIPNQSSMKVLKFYLGPILLNFSRL